MQWFYMQGNRQVGPLEETELAALIPSGQFTPQTPVWRKGMPDWLIAGQTELLRLFQEPQPVRPTSGIVIRSDDAQQQGSFHEDTPSPQQPTQHLQPQPMFYGQPPMSSVVYPQGSIKKIAKLFFICSSAGIVFFVVQSFLFNHYFGDIVTEANEKQEALAEHAQNANKWEQQNVQHQQEEYLKIYLDMWKKLHQRMEGMGSEKYLPVIFSFLYMGFFIVALVFWLVLIYRCWNLIQDGAPRTTPGAAVGLLFIPFYNYFWVFVAVADLAKGMNTYVSYRNIPTTPVSTGLAFAHSFLFIPTSIICCTVFFFPFFWIATTLLVFNLAGCAEAISDAKQSDSNQDINLS